MAPWSVGRNGKYTIHIVTFCPKLCIKLYDSISGVTPTGATGALAPVIFWILLSKLEI